MSSRLVERAAGALSRRLDRRGFVSRAALVGSAAVVAPVKFALTPTSAYAAVCNCNGSRCVCGSMCCDGYTEFCCTLTGVNACPPGTVAAGWWKVDGSEFCGGAARYYLDCNAQCGGCGCGRNGICDGACSGTRCGCAGGNCNNRKSGCTKFRYGQCHQEIPCLGPIVCRVVTCTPPWLYDPSCTTSVRTDNATRSHHRPCLDQPVGALDQVTDLGGTVRVSGWAVDQTDRIPTEIRIFVDGRLASRTHTNVPRPDVSAVVQGSYPAQGFDVEVPVEPGTRLFCIFAIDQNTGKGTTLGVVQRDIVPLRGSFDAVSARGPARIAVAGWAVDPLGPDHQAIVRVKVDGRTVLEFMANWERADLPAHYPTIGPRHGFHKELSVHPGPRTICLELVGRRGTVVDLGCRDIVVPDWPE